MNDARRLRANEAARRWRDRNPLKARQAYQRWRGTHREQELARLKEEHLRVYGLTAVTYVELLDAQGDTCAVCKKPLPEHMSRFNVDHDHKCCPAKKSCGKCIRGLLCHDCNLLLGYAHDDIGVLQSAITYLEGGYPYQRERTDY